MNELLAHALKALDDVAAQMRLLASVEIHPDRAKGLEITAKTIEAAVKNIRIALRLAA